MKIEKFEDLVPYIGRVVIGWWYREDEKEYPYIDNITTYIKKAADGLRINYDSLYSDLKSNLMYYYSDPYQGPMKSEKELTHIIDDTRTLWLTEVVYNEDASIGRKEYKKVYPRLDLSILYDTPFSSEKKKVKGELKPRKNYGKGERNMDLKDSIRFFSEPDSSTVILQSIYFWDNPVQSLFTTEEEAKSYIESAKPKEKKKPKVKKTYEKFLEEAEKLGADQIQELIGELEKLYDNKIDELDLNPLQIALTYQDKADQVDSYIIGKETAIRDWIDKNMDPYRYETVEYGNILDRILEEYDEGIEWKDIKEEDQEVITEIAEELRGGCKGFKWDW